MSLLGKGAVAIWHDIAPAGRRDFYAWHGIEHMRERVAIPGFRCGRRFVATDAAAEFFNLYEADSLDVLKGPDYRARLNDPTPWTLATVTHFRNVSRAICGVAASMGWGQGGLVATLRYQVPESCGDAHRRDMAGVEMPRLAAADGIAAVHLLVADADASGEMTAERQARGTATEVPSYVLILEGWGDEAAFADLVRREAADDRLAELDAVGPFDLGFYRHQITTLAPA